LVEGYEAGVDANDDVNGGDVALFSGYLQA
jgi:hypothetical protein